MIAQSSLKKKKVANGAVKSQPLNRKTVRDESVSGSGSEDDETLRNDNDVETLSSESEDEDETGAERRLRLAEQYLENIKGETETVGFDAEEIDRDLIAERLKEDAVWIMSDPLGDFHMLMNRPGGHKRSTVPSYSLWP